jgi:integrase
VRQYLLHLINDHHACTNTVLLQRAALRFLYVSTLKQKWFDDEIARPKRRRTLPGILSVEEVTRILDHTHNLKHWTMLATFYATGLRCNELRHLRKCQASGDSFTAARRCAAVAQRMGASTFDL